MVGTCLPVYLFKFRRFSFVASFKAMFYRWSRWTTTLQRDMILSCWGDSSCKILSSSTFPLVCQQLGSLFNQDGSRGMFSACAISLVLRVVISIGKVLPWRSRSTLHGRREARPGLQIERSIAEETPLPTVKCVISPVLKKTSKLLSARFSVRNPPLFVIRHPQVELWALKSPTRSNGDGRCSTISCRSSARY